MMTCTVSMPDNSSKNQPQLVYISMAWRCISSSDSTVTISGSDSSRRAWVARNLVKAGSAAVEHDVDVIVAGLPGIEQQLRGLALVGFDQAVAQMIERLAQGRAPGLVPARLAAGVAAAVGVPAAHAVRAAPGGVLEDLDFVGRRIDGEILAVVGEPGELVGLDVMQRVGQRHLALEMMMAVGLAVSGDVHELRPAAVLGEAADQPVGETFAIGEQAFEGDGAGDGSVVEKQVDAAARRQIADVGTGGVDLAALDVLELDGANARVPVAPARGPEW